MVEKEGMISKWPWWELAQWAVESRKDRGEEIATVLRAWSPG